MWAINPADEVFVRSGLSKEDSKGKEWTKIDGSMKTVRYACIISSQYITVAANTVLDPLVFAGLWIRRTLCGEGSEPSHPTP